MITAVAVAVLTCFATQADGAASAPHAAPSTTSAWSAPATGADSGVFFGGALSAAFAIPTSPTQQIPWPTFALPRAELGGGVVYERWLLGLVRVETIRSASPQSAFGIDGNSLLPRLRLAYAGLRPELTLWSVPLAFELRAGLIPNQWLESVEAHTALRGLGPLLSEDSGALVSSDLGASASVDVADGAFSVAVSIENGEGKAEVEQNPGKDLGVIIATTPVVAVIADDALRVGLLAGWRDGSVGVASGRNHRGLAAAVVSHPRFHVGVEGVWAQGLAGRPDRERLVGGAWAYGVIVDGVVGAFARADVGQDVKAFVPEDASDLSVSAGAFTDFGRPWRDNSVLQRLRLSVAGSVEQRFGTAAVVGAQEASTAWALHLTLELVAGSEVIDVVGRWSPPPSPEPVTPSPEVQP